MISIIPNTNHSLITIDYCEGDDGDIDHLYVHPIIGWQIITHDQDHEPESHAIPIRADGGNPPSTETTIYNKQTKEWYIAETADGKGLNNLIEYLKDKVKYEYESYIRHNVANELNKDNDRDI